MLKFLKRTLLTIFALILVGIVLRGWLYRHLVAYQSIGQRENYPATNELLIEFIESNSENTKDARAIVQRALDLTSQKLNFVAAKSESNPNQLIQNGQANCIGYAAFTATICNHLLAKHGMAARWSARPQIGQLYFLGTNVHPYFKSAFFKDHDFVLIQNSQTGERLCVDPTVSDYLGVDFASEKQR